MKFVKYAVASALLMSALPAQAGTGSGLVRQIVASVNGVVQFQVDTHTSAPACSTIRNEFAFDGSTAEGKNKYALLLAAANAKKTISVAGTGKCSAWPDREDAQFIVTDF